MVNTPPPPPPEALPQLPPSPTTAPTTSSTLHAQQLQYDCDNLSQQAAHLSTLLARRRADLSLMRAEAATVAMSLEDAKHRLDNALRNEALIRTTAAAPSSPRPFHNLLEHMPHQGQSQCQHERKHQHQQADSQHELQKQQQQQQEKQHHPQRGKHVHHNNVVHDVGLMRALQGQLDVTRKSVHHALHRRDALRAEIAALQAASPSTTAPPGAPMRHMYTQSPALSRTPPPPNTQPMIVLSPFLQGQTDTQQMLKGASPGATSMSIASPSSLLLQVRNAVTAAAQVPLPPSPQPQLQGDGMSAVAESGGGCTVLPRLTPHELSVLRVLDNGATSRSSFRFDHARIWRDVTMPNLILVPDEPSPSSTTMTTEKTEGNPLSEAEVTLGVVTERIFEGVTCFTPAAGNSGGGAGAAGISAKASGSSNDMRIDAFGPAFMPEGALLEMIARQFGILHARTTNLGDSVMGSGGEADVRELRVIGPAVALQRVCRLVSDAKGRALGVVTRSPVWRAGGEDAERRVSSSGGGGVREMGSNMLAVGSPPVVALHRREGANNARDQLATGALHVTESDTKLLPLPTTEIEKPSPETTPMTSPTTSSSTKVTNRPAPKKTHASAVLTDLQFAQLVEEGVPVRFQSSMLTLLYSTEIHGMSLRTLYSQVRTSSPTLVVILDTHGRRFGCYAAAAWKSSTSRYYGSGESFVFGVRRQAMPLGDDREDGNRDRGDGDEGAAEGDVSVFKWSRANSFFQFTASSFLAIGGGTGSHFALWVDEDLLMGTTSQCATFSSPPLTDLDAAVDDGSCREFKILAVEVWAFGVQRRR